MPTELNGTQHPQIPWNKGKVIGQKRPLKLQEVWAIRIRLQLAQQIRELALFNLAIDSKLRGCDLVGLHVSDIAHGHTVMTAPSCSSKKLRGPSNLRSPGKTREALTTWIAHAKLKDDQFLFPSRKHALPHLSTWQYARVVERWVISIGLDPSAYGTHAMRRTKATLIYKRTKNLRAVQLLLGHSKLESTVHYLGIEVDDALDMAEQTEV
ncbi:MAG: tyrosine-type recombinase/integrase [Acidithiobacillus sp.]